MKTSKIIFSLLLLSVAVVPFAVVAVTLPTEPTGGITDVAGIFTAVASIIWPIAMGVAFIVFLVAGILFATSGGDPEKVKTARDYVLYGVVGIVVAILAYSLVTIVSGVF